MKARQWHPHRERVESISPNAISPYDWEDRGGPGGSNGYVNVPIWHNRSVAYYIHRFRLLAGYIAKG